MNFSSFFLSLLFYCIILSFLAGGLFLTQNFQYFQYIDSALFAAGITIILLLARKYMTDSYGNEKYHDFFLLDSVLILSGMILFSCYFIISL